MVLNAVPTVDAFNLVCSSVAANSANVSSIENPAAPADDAVLRNAVPISVTFVAELSANTARVLSFVPSSSVVIPKTC